MDTTTDAQWLSRLWARPADDVPPSSSSAADTDTSDADDTQDSPARRELGLTGWLACAAAATTVAAIVFNGTLANASRTQSAPIRPVTQAIPVVAGTTTTSAQTASSHPLAFLASADCPVGASTTAAGLANVDKPVPWICVRHTEGQLLHLILVGPGGVEHSSVVTKFSIVPGDIGPVVGNGRDPWLEHRCVKLIQLQFNDVEHSQPIPLDTQCVHGEVSVSVPNITASQLTMIVRQTARPSVPASQTSTPDNGMLGDLVFPGPPSGVDQPDQGTDPCDGTFAVGAVKVEGYETSR